MKLVSCRIGKRETFGVVSGQGLIDVGVRMAGRCRDLREAIAADLLGDIARMCDGLSADADLSDIEFLPVVADPGMLLCVGLNYAAHIKEMGRDMPKYPALFSRYPRTHVGHRQPMVRPQVSDMFDYEGELAFVIGRGGRCIPVEKALEHVAGYTCYNDGSVRDWQRHTSQFLPGKNFSRSGAFGPWLVTTDEIPDPSQLTLSTRLNGEVMQHIKTDDLIFGVPQLVNYISTFTELEPGDVVLTGTPGGVGAGRKPPVFMRPGDSVEVEITGIGILSNPIVAEESGETRE